jgi:hypothetical protein
MQGKVSKERREQSSEPGRRIVQGATQGISRPLLSNQWQLNYD